MKNKDDKEDVISGEIIAHMARLNSDSNPLPIPIPKNIKTMYAGAGEKDSEKLSFLRTWYNTIQYVRKLDEVASTSDSAPLIPDYVIRSYKPATSKTPPKPNLFIDVWHKTAQIVRKLDEAAASKDDSIPVIPEYVIRSYKPDNTTDIVAWHTTLQAIVKIHEKTRPLYEEGGEFYKLQFIEQPNIPEDLVREYTKSSDEFKDSVLHGWYNQQFPRGQSSPRYSIGSSSRKSYTRPTTTTDSLGSPQKLLRVKSETTKTIGVLEQLNLRSSSSQTHERSNSPR